MNRKPLIAAGTVMGIGLGSFIDGILFHQLLQSNHMISARVIPDSFTNLQATLIWDGIWYIFSLIVIIISVSMLWRSAQRQDVPWSASTFVGAQVFGWGIFNMFEGLLNHHILGIHHVVENAGLSVYDYTYLAFGIVFITLGLLIIRIAKESPTISRFDSKRRVW